MSDVNLDSSFNWGPVRTGMEEMRAFATQTTSQISKSFSGMFAGAIATGGVIAGFQSIVNAAHDIHHEAERFGIDAQQLQLIGNAAKEQGIPLELVARAMNLLQINSYKATQAENDQAKALEALGINAETFFRLSPDQKMLALADAYKNAGDKGAAYAQIAKLIGTRNTELIPLLEQGAAAIREQSDAMATFSTNTVEQLERVHRAWEIFTTDIKVFAGTAFVDFSAGFSTGVYAIMALLTAMQDAFTTSFTVINRVLHFDFSGAIREAKDGAAQIKDDLASVKEFQDQQFGNKPAPIQVSTDDAKAKITALQAQIDALKSPTVTPAVSSDDAKTKIDALQAKIDAIKSPTVTPLVQTDDAKNKIADLQAQIDAIKAPTVVPAVLDDAAKGKIIDLQAQIDAIKAPAITPEALTDDAKAKIAALQDQINEIKSPQVVPRVLTDDAKAKIAQLETEIAAIQSAPITPAVLTDDAKARIADLQSQIDTLSAHPESVKLSTADATTKVASLQSQIDKLSSAPIAPGAGVAAPVSGAGAGETTGSSNFVSKDLREQITLQEKLDKLERDRAFNQLSDGGKLEALQRERNALDLQSSDYSQGDLAASKARVAAAEKEKEIDTLTAKMSQEQVDYDEKIAKARQDMAEQADKELADAVEQNKELALEAAGRKDLAERAKIEYEFDNKIADAVDKKNKALELGDQAVANTNAALVTQLSLEKQNALAAHDKAQAEEMAAKAAAEKVNVDSEKQNLADLKEENIEIQLKNAGLTEAADLTKNAYDYNVKINDALSQANDLWTQMAAAYAAGNVALGDQLAIHAQLKQDEADELGLLKQQTAEEIKQKQAIKDAADALEAANKLAQLTNVGGLPGVSAQGQTLPGHFFPQQQSAGISLFGGGAFGDIRALQATNPFTGKFDAEAYAKLLFQDAIDSARIGVQTTQQIPLGSTPGFFENIAAQKQYNAIADFQAKQSQAVNQSVLDNLLKIQQSALYGSDAAATSNQNLINTSFAPFAYPQSASVVSPSAPAVTTEQLQQQITLLQQQLTAVQTTNKLLTPVAGK